MPDEKRKQPPKKKESGIGDEVADGLIAARYPGYAAYKREAKAMGEDVLPPAEWAKRNKRQ